MTLIRELDTEEVTQLIREFALGRSYLYDPSMSEKLSGRLKKFPCLDPSEFYLFKGINGLEKLRRITPETFESHRDELELLLDLTIPLFLEEKLHSALWLNSGFIYSPSSKEYRPLTSVYVRGLAEINPAVTLEICVSDRAIIAETEEHLRASLSMEIIRPDGFSRYSNSLFQSERKTMGFRYENGIWNINYCD